MLNYWKCKKQSTFIGIFNTQSTKIFSLVKLINFNLTGLPKSRNALKITKPNLFSKKQTLALKIVNLLWNYNGVFKSSSIWQMENLLTAVTVNSCNSERNTLTHSLEKVCNTDDSSLPPGNRKRIFPLREWKIPTFRDKNGCCGDSSR